jgi:hypothetical protein
MKLIPLSRDYTNVIFLASLQFDKHPYHILRTMENVIRKKKKWGGKKIEKRNGEKTNRRKEHSLRMTRS